MEASKHFQGQQPFTEIPGTGQEAVKIRVVKAAPKNEESDEPPRFSMYVNGVKVATLDVDVFNRLDTTSINSDGSFQRTGIQEAIVTGVDSDIVARNNYLQLGANSLAAAVRRVYPDVSIVEGQPVEDAQRH